MLFVDDLTCALIYGNNTRFSQHLSNLRYEFILCLSAFQLNILFHVSLSRAMPLFMTSGRCPGVSIRVKGPKSLRTRERVVPASGETGESCSPLILLKSVLLPVLGWPTMTTILSRFRCTSPCACFQFKAFMKVCIVGRLGRDFSMLVPTSRGLRGRFEFRKTLLRYSSATASLFCSSSPGFFCSLLATRYILP